jgi:hypothetical protein
MFDSEYGPMAGFCEHCNEPSSSTIGGEFIHLVTVSFSGWTVLHGVRLGWFGWLVGWLVWLVGSTSRNLRLS